MYNEFGYDGNLGFNGFEDQASNPNPINWNAILQQAFAVGSHAISAFSGQNTGTQVGYNTGQGGVFAIQPNVQNNAGGYATNPYAGMTAEQQIAYQKSIGGGVGSGIDGALSWVTQNPLLVGGIALGAYLLFKDPPRSRR